jgi:hypothetical protein
MWAIKQSNRKAAGINSISPDILKEDTPTTDLL